MTSPAHCLHPGNLATYLSLCSAIGALAAATHGSAAGAGALMAIAVMADTFDGRFARLFRRTEAQRALGSFLDSLSDAAAFGLVPPCCMTLLMPPAPSRLIETGWWLSVCCYAACAITRLAFYHLPATSGATFVGVPAPVAALLWSSALLLQPGWTAAPLVFTAIGLSMIAPLPIRRPAGAGLAAFVSWPVAVFAAHLGNLAR
jgi:phosphatidylserine synthase